MPPRRPGSRRRIAAEPSPGLFPAGEDLVRLLAVLVIAAAAAAACSVLNRRPQPFCDSPQSPDDYADDSCQPCPHNGRCVNGELECVQGFKRHGKACVEDGLLSQTANRIVLHSCYSEGSAVSMLVLYAANLPKSWSAIYCDLYSIHSLSCYLPRLVLPGFHQFQEHHVSDAVDELLSKNPAGLTQDGILLVKTRVIETAQDFFETTFTPDKRRALSNRAEQIYEQVCEILEDDAINAKIGDSDCEPWVVASWLRDHLLVPRERKNAFLWKKVEELILEDSRIDQYPKVIKGESKVVYEWQASGSLSAKSKKVQGKRVKSGIGAGAVKLAQETDACLG
ncbi:hypothetical protein U9M48_005767 [Paspalum notatum var. saurae]|uniref:Man1/Src1 C-terminal domain-containing protein n=1 Tax=Paspalum notatum var. saurae TaxID=547442 RepID=A0AAQ3SLY3_PASNO